jgi:hypothetical protein
MLAAVIHNGLTFQAPVNCVTPHFVTGLNGLCLPPFQVTIRPSDRIAGKANISVVLTFAVFSPIPPGGSITLAYPPNFFVPHITPVVAAGASSVADLNIVCEPTSTTAVVLTTSVAINALVMLSQLPSAVLPWERQLEVLTHSQ